MNEEIISRHEYYGGGQLKKPGNSSRSNLSDLDRHEMTAWKKSLHTNMTSRVLEDRNRQDDLRSSFNSQRQLSEKGLNRVVTPISGMKMQNQPINFSQENLFKRDVNLD